MPHKFCHQSPLKAHGKPKKKTAHPTLSFMSIRSSFELPIEIAWQNCMRFSHFFISPLHEPSGHSLCEYVQEPSTPLSEALPPGAQGVLRLSWFKGPSSGLAINEAVA